MLPPCLQASSLYHDPWVLTEVTADLPRPQPLTLFQEYLAVLSGGAPKGLGLTWSVSRAHTQSHGPARRARLSRIIRLGGFLAISKGGGHHDFKRRSLKTLPAFE